MKIDCKTWRIEKKVLKTFKNDCQAKSPRLLGSQWGSASDFACGVTEAGYFHWQRGTKLDTREPVCRAGCGTRGPFCIVGLRCFPRHSRVSSAELARKNWDHSRPAEPDRFSHDGPSPLSPNASEPVDSCSRPQQSATSLGFSRSSRRSIGLIARLVFATSQVDNSTRPNWVSTSESERARTIPTLTSFSHFSNLFVYLSINVFKSCRSFDCQRFGSGSWRHFWHLRNSPSRNQNFPTKFHIQISTISAKS